MKVVVGLGNPGDQYLKTRHNVGFRTVAELSRRHGGEKPRSRFEAEVVEIFMGSQKVLLVAPQTYMNNSGRSVAAITRFFQLESEDLLVVCDDMNLDTARLRLRGAGSAGGQNGLKDIIRHWGGEDFARLRIGIGRPPGRMSSSDYVLGRFRKEEVEEIEHTVIKAADGVEKWINNGLENAMNWINPSTKQNEKKS
ncbi:Peptidyl-tRNA hydrolase [hydrothermal vent metagenome]|uniref:Peptidyl-tRNA hydrolase n=1 Tax=hydrothermal vent metagenome TaxID=652676 RepID=A0A3B1DNH4_9ZZZZ